MRNRADDILKWIKGPAILDIGCAGHVVKPDSPFWLHGRLRERFEDITGVDINGDNIEQIKQLGFDNLRQSSADSFALGRRYDTVVAGELIEHLSNPGLFFERAREHVNDNGVVVLSTPQPFALANLLYALVKFPKTCSNEEHTCWFCPETMQELASRYGFRVKHWELIEDYLNDVPSVPYRTMVTFIRVFRWLIPERLRCNAMLFVFEVDRAGT